MKYLLDADIVAFKAATSVERPVNWGDGMWTLHAYEAEAIDAVHDYLDRVTKSLGRGEFFFFLTAPKNWRKDILPTYKENRKSVRKPLLLPFLREWMQEEWNAVITSPLEADDLIGIAATATTDDCIIVSEDKDLLTIPAKVYNPAKGELHDINEYTATYNHMFQTLVGDKTDGYDGCPTIGAVRAHRILEEAKTVEEMWEMVVQAYQKQGLSKSVALQQAQVSRICHASDFDERKGKVIPWTP